MKNKKLVRYAFVHCALILVFLGGCLDVPYVEIAPERASVPLGALQRDDYRPVAVDVLLVIDNSGSMAQEQDMMARDFPVLIREILSPFPSAEGKTYLAAADLHVGVVSTDLGVGGYDIMTCQDNLQVGDDGILQHEPHGEGCAPSYPDFLSYENPSGSTPDPGAIDRLAADFGCIARLGTDGCGFEQQLEAAYRALAVQSAPGGANEGFLRRDSVIALLFITDEYDCSTTDTTIFDIRAHPFDIGLTCLYNSDKLFPVSRYADMMRSLRSSDERFAVGFIVGVPPDDPVCSGRGDSLAGCLDLPQMQLVADPHFCRPQLVCIYPVGCEPSLNCSTEAYPGRRFVELAQMLGASATVHSVCAPDYVEAVNDLAGLVKEKFTRSSHNQPPYFVKSDADPSGCRCELLCTVIEELPAGESCREGKTPYDDGSGRTLCVIPQVGSILANCGLECGDPSALYTPAPGRGWWYDPAAEGGPAVEFVGLVPEEGAALSVTCE